MVGTVRILQEESQSEATSSTNIALIMVSRQYSVRVEQFLTHTCRSRPTPMRLFPDVIGRAGPVEPSMVPFDS